MASPSFLRVVIADDETLVCTLIQSELEQLGHQVVGRAADGVQAVRLVADLQPDVAILDITMPERDGIEATAQIQKLCPTPVVILTAHDDPVLVNSAARSGSAAYLIKPPAARELERAIVVAIARHADLMRLQESNQKLQRALADVKTLSGLLPICSRCKKIRDDRGYWNEVEVYIQQHSSARFSHGICLECAQQLYPDIKVGLVREAEASGNSSAGAPGTTGQRGSAEPRFPILDREGLLKRAGNDEELARSAVAAVLAEIPDRIAALHDCLAAGNLPGVRQVAGTIKTSALMIGADALRAAGVGIEDAARDGQMARLRSGIYELEHQFVELTRVSRREFRQFSRRF